MLAVPEAPAGFRQARIHALVTAGGTLVLTAILVGLFDPDSGALQFVDHVGWAEQVGLSWDVGVDGISLWLLLLSAVIFLLVIGAACWRPPERPRAFLGLLLLAETGLLGLFAAGHLVLFYVFWEAMLVPFYFLIGMWGSEGRGRATTRFVIYTMVGSLLMLVSILATAFIARDATGQFTFVIRDLVGVAFTETQSTWLFAGFAIAFAIKLPLWPFHGWLPGAYRAAPILVTVLLAAVMSKAGVYGFLRIGLPVFPEGADNLAIPIAVLGVAGIVYGSLLAWRAPTMRMLVAYSSLAHLGFIALGVMAFDIQASQGAVLQMVNHGVVVAAAFAIVGIINRAEPDDRIDDIGGLAAGAPRLAGVFLIVAMASLAIPGFELVRGRVPDPDRRLPPAPLADRPRLHRDHLRGRLHAAPLPERDERAAARRVGGRRRAARAGPGLPAPPGGGDAGDRAVAQRDRGHHHEDAREDDRPGAGGRRPPGRRDPGGRAPEPAGLCGAAAGRRGRLRGRRGPAGDGAVSELNVVAATPLIISAGTAVLAMGAGLLPGRAVRRHGPAAVGIAGIVAAIVMSVVLWGDRQEAFSGGLRADRFSLLMNIIFLSAALLTILLAWREPAAVDRRGEFVGLILISATGMMLVAGAGDLISIFLGVEVLSVSLYVLCALEVWRERSLESGLKYLITGAVGAAILLYGLTLLFGATGSTSLAVIGETLGQSSFSDEPLLVAAMALIASGLAFKASAAPFHMWTPDVYEGAPTTVTAFMSTATKAAAFAAFLRIFSGALPDLQPDWRAAIATIAVASIVVGNIAALVQTNMKRLLAYSSIAQAGYLLIGVAVGTIDGAEAVLYYLLAYGAMTMAAFAVVIIREREVEDGDTLAALRGYGRARPVLGVVMTVSMLSLAGFPPLSGFIGKFLLFGAAVEGDMTWLAIVGALGSIVSLGYYLRVVGVTWLTPLEGEPRKVLRVPGPVGLATVTSGVAVLALAVFASPVLDACRGAAESLLAP